MSILEIFVPPKTGEIILNDDLAAVIERISEVLPAEAVWRYFSSSPSETGGIKEFPYCRIDGLMYAAHQYMGGIEELKAMGGDFDHAYKGATETAMKILLWVEVGFQGLENLAKSPASKNWTSGVGHSATDSERELKINTEGKKMYQAFLTRFITFRRNFKMSGDCFDEYKLEHLLEL